MASLVGILRRRSKPSDDGEREDDGGNTIPFTTDCYACTQVGVPAFHSTSCSAGQAQQQPQWEASAGSSLIPIPNKPAGKQKPTSFGRFRRVYDPRSKTIQRWNRFVLLARGMALAVDPLFFYVLSIGGRGGGGRPCLYVNGSVAVVVAGMRTLIDCFHVVHMWLQFRVAYVSRESLVIGCGKLVWDPQSISSRYLKSGGGFWYDAFVILPVPQVVFWLLVPRLIEEERIKTIMTTLLLIFVFQFLPKVYHSISLMTRMAQVTGYIFGTIWWGFALNLIAYFIASHVAGCCWYTLAIQRVILCLRQQCANQNACILTLSCTQEVCYGFLAENGSSGRRCAGNSTMDVVKMQFCLDPDGPYHYGIYQGALPVISSNSLSIKIIYPIFWGLMSLSTFGNNFDPTSHWLEVMFSICIVLSGIMLFTLLIGNIQVFLHAVMARKKKMQLRSRDMEWWMKRRQLPSLLRQRVRHHEYQNWAVMGGADEMELIKDFPEGLRLDIKRFLCLDLIRMVPLFHDLEDLILDNICDRIKPLVFSKDEKIIREGDLVQRMVFIVQGSVKSNQKLSKGVVATSMLYPGGYLGDELLSWCLRRPTNISRLPSSSATFTCLQPTEALGLDANHLRYITDHFRYKFANERLKRTVRYYSSNWRTWAAVNIQLGWRRYVARMRPAAVEVVTVENGGGDRRLRQYAAIFMSIRPHDHLE